MASEPNAVSRLKKLVKEIPEEMEVFDMLQSLEGQDSHASDRAAAIVGASLLESALETTIFSHFTPFLDDRDRAELFHGDGAPLATFSSRIRIGYALALYGSTTKDQLNRIRAVRNAFAHSSRGLSFDTKEVSDVVKGLTLYGGKSLSGKGPIKTPKERYVTNVAYIVFALKTVVSKASRMAEMLMKEHLRDRLP